MKYCNICGTPNLNENNYCTHCGNWIVVENICPFCGETNPDSSSHCVKCNNQITPVAIDSFEVLLSEYNRILILNSSISDSVYFDIIYSMFKKLDYITIKGDTPKEKVLQIANVFAPCIPKSSGVALGETSANVIFYDDRLDDSIQISTIIHELAHCLLFNLVDNFLCKIFDVKSTPIIKSFAEFFLTSSKIEVLNEYFAHTVENRFIPHEYQNFGSFNQCVKSSDVSDDEVRIFKDIANSYATDFIHFLQKYIDNDLRESIKLQYKKDLVIPDQLEFSHADAVLPINEKNAYMFELIGIYFEILYNSEEAREELEYIKIKYMG